MVSVAVTWEGTVNSTVACSLSPKFRTAWIDPGSVGNRVSTEMMGWRLSLPS